MWKYTIAVVVLVLAVPVCRAQYGTADSGYYPTAYEGQTFIGNVASTNDRTREIALKYTDAKRMKSDVLIGVLDEGYAYKIKGGGLHELKPSEIRIGAILKVYYMPATKKIGGKKVNINTIFFIEGAPDARDHYYSFRTFTNGK